MRLLRAPLPLSSYVAEMHQLSLRGMTSQGFAGKHELVVGGFKQVGSFVGSCALDDPYAPWKSGKHELVAGGFKQVGTHAPAAAHAEPLVCTGKLLGPTVTASV